MKRFLILIFLVLDGVSPCAAGSMMLLGAGRSVSSPPYPIDLNLASNTIAGLCASFTACLGTTNASTTYVTNSDGTLTSIAANTLRIGVGSGLLVESSATNPFIQNMAVDNAAWSKSASTATANVVNAPDGTLTADRIVGNTTAVGHSTQNTTGVTLTAADYTVSIYVKPDGYSFAALIAIGGTGSTTRSSSVFNLTTCAVTQTGTQGSPTDLGSSCVLLANGWVRISQTQLMTATATASFLSVIGTATGTPTVAVNLQPNASQDGTSGIDLWCAQIELGTVPSSCIATTTTSVTRAADNVAVSGALATLLATSTASLVVNTNSSLQSVAATLVDANGVVLLGKTAGNLGTTAVGATLSTGNTGTWTSTNDLGLAWDGTGGIIQLNGGTTATDATARTPAATFHVGSTSGSSAFFNGYFTRIRGYNTKLASPQ